MLGGGVAVIIYSSEMKSHVKEIDKQHQWLIDLINAFDSIETKKLTDAKIEKMLTLLSDYVVGHFSYEEDLMLENGYTDYEWHSNWHRSYIVKLDGLKTEFLNNGLSEEFVHILNEFVVKWIVTHIKNVDVKFGAFINEKKRKK